MFSNVIRGDNGNYLATTKFVHSLEKAISRENQSVTLDNEQWSLRNLGELEELERIVEGFVKVVKNSKKFQKAKRIGHKCFILFCSCISYFTKLYSMAYCLA